MLDGSDPVNGLEARYTSLVIKNDYGERGHVRGYARLMMLRIMINSYVMLLLFLEGLGKLKPAVAVPYAIEGLPRIQGYIVLQCNFSVCSR